MISPILAAALLVTQAAPQMGCITRQEAGDLALSILPQMIEGVARRCAQQVPETAFLRTGAPALAERLRAESPGARERAAAAFTRMSNRPLPQGMRPEVALDALAGGLTEGPLRNLDAASCAEVGNVIEALSPLPASSFAQLAASALAMASARSGGGGPRLCPA